MGIVLPSCGVRQNPHDVSRRVIDDGYGVLVSNADDDVTRREAGIALVEPAIRTDVCGGIDVQPVERAARPAESRSGLDRSARVLGKAELVDVIARRPFPQDLPVP